MKINFLITISYYSQWLNFKHQNIDGQLGMALLITFIIIVIFYSIIKGIAWLIYGE